MKRAIYMSFIQKKKECLVFFLHGFSETKDLDSFIYKI